MSRHGRARWLVPAATLVLLALGTATVAVAATLALTDPAERGTPTGVEPTPQVPELSGDVPTSPDPGAADGPLAELADPAWITRTAAATGIPERALAAYAGASIAVEPSRPGCGLGWNTLAGIGLVESEHGSLDGATLDPSGTARPPITGVPLDGEGVAEVRDTDGGKLDGDATWDRAVGPMQFIPTTWDRFASDGNDDGVTDIHQVDDAALAAAVFLCSGGADLTSADDWARAVTRYNPDPGYVRSVARAATSYADPVG